VEAAIKKAGVAARLEDSKNSGRSIVATGARSFLVFFSGLAPKWTLTALSLPSQFSCKRR
jgi:hypothetical protein